MMTTIVWCLLIVGFILGAVLSFMFHSATFAFSLARSLLLLLLFLRIRR